MKTIGLYILTALLFVTPVLQAQNNEGIRRSRTQESTPKFILRGEVIDAENDTPIGRVNVEIDGGDYTTTNKSGEFMIDARLGDQLTIRSDDFETVYLTVTSQERITVRVEKAPGQSMVLEEMVTAAKRNKAKDVDLFQVNIDSARFYLRTDAKRSIEFVTLALESTGKSASRAQNSLAQETLGDINMHWEQYDLAIGNYKRSISEQSTADRRLKLASAYMLNKNYQESITTYTELLEGRLTNYQQVEAYEGLGDVYKAINDPVNSVANYQKGLDIANRRKIVPKITDLNSKIGSAYAQGGAAEEAEGYFLNSLNLANEENKKRAVTEQNTVADFYNFNQDFDKEIELRQGLLDSLSTFGDSELEDDLDSPLTPQRQNYKIANAFVAQNRYEEAIPYLEKSIEEADESEDLVVQKDATRKLSEIYRDLGDFGKAAESYEQYIDIFNDLYVQKEQELSQAARFSKEIALTQSRIASLENERDINESRYQLAFQNQELIEKNNRVQKWIIGSLILIAILLMYTAYSQFRRGKQQKFANDVLALKSLRTQMNPHFIFNALNSVNSFIASNDERAANKYLSEFSQLMRAVLENSEEDFIPLAKEIELLELYVKLEHFRFQDKFDYTVTIDENLRVEEFVIPPMLLQPYVENAVWHGLRYKEEKGLLGITFEQKDTETVTITIEDNGIGRKRSKALKTDHQKKQKSKGMGNIQKRISILNTMYKDKVDVTVKDVASNGEGTRVVLTLKKD